MIPQIAARRLLDELFDAPKGERDPEGRSEGHIIFMLEEIADSRVTGEKAHRWLGYAQGIMVLSGTATLEEMKELNRKAQPPPSMKPPRVWTTSEKRSLAERLRDLKNRFAPVSYTWEMIGQRIGISEEDILGLMRDGTCPDDQCDQIEAWFFDNKTVLKDALREGVPPVEKAE